MDQNPKIVCIIGTMEAGGAERVMAQLCNHFAEQRYDIVLLTLSASSNASFFALSDDVKRQGLDYPEFWARFGSLTRVGTRIATLRKKIISLCPDVIISFVDLTNITVLLATIGLKIPVIISERVDPAAHAHRLPRLSRMLRRWTYPCASRIVVQTSRAARFFDDFLPEKIATIPNPVPPSGHTALPSLASADGRFRIIGIGRLDHQKGFDTLINSFATLAARFPDWDIVIFGQGPDRAALLAHIKNYGLESRIRLMGVAPDVASEIALSHLIAFPSRYEGFPNALAEAMAAGLPAVAFANVSGVEDLVVSGETGLLVPSAQTSSGNLFADALAQLMRAPELRDRMGKAAKNRVDIFRPEIVFGHWDDVVATAHYHQ